MKHYSNNRYNFLYYKYKKNYFSGNLFAQKTQIKMNFLNNNI